VNLLESHSYQMIKGMAFPQTIQHDEHRCMGGRLARGLTRSPKHGKAIAILEVRLAATNRAHERVHGHRKQFMNKRNDKLFQ
jgi:hypothetical protein